MTSNQHPRILAIETSGRQGSVAVARGPELLALRELSPATRHAAELMPAVRDLTAAQGWTPQQIDHIYVSMGPGSFTGVRIAIAAARALHQAIGCKLVGVPSLAVIAHNAPAEFGLVLPILDAKREQVFAAAFARDQAGMLLQVREAALVRPADFVEEMRGLSAAESQPPMIAILGEGLGHYQPPPDRRIVALPAPLWPARAEQVYRLGYRMALRNAFTDPAAFLPLYMRQPEAEEVYRKKHAAV